MKNRFATALVVLLIVSTFSVAQESSQADRAMQEALKTSPLEENLRQLTDEIGGRVPGTPAMVQAVLWGVAAFKTAGADSVHTEEFVIPASWTEGDTRVEVTSPGRFSLRAVSIAWSPALPRVHARVVDVGKGTTQDFSKAGDIAGAIVLVHSEVLKTWEDLFNEYLAAPPIIDAALRGHAVAIAWTATREHDILYRHINTLDGKIDRIPQVLLAREDAQRLARLIAAGKPVEVDLALPNRIGPSVRAANVVAEIRGSDLPDEMVIVGAHLDSWNLGTGALDNGCNAALLVDALRAIRAAGVKPRRSIRFIMFSGEEQGMLGSLAYVRQHNSEMGNVVAEIIFDTGTGPATGFSVGGRDDVKAALQPMLAPFSQWNATEVTADAFVGTDNLDFLLEGVPNLVANQKEANYLENYHATSDTYDKVDFPQLKKHVAMTAYLATAIADAPKRLGPRQDRAQIEQTMRQSHLDDQLKVFGMWPDWAGGKRGRK
jgi:carboxypeptidase Q